GNAVSGLVPLQRYQFGNHLGSSSVELDANGALIAYEEYHPYGTTSFQAGRSAAEVSVKRYRYTAKERDGETGLSYHSSRYYASWLGRWIATDPAGFVDGLNVYQYVRGNPVAHSDVLGLAAESTNQSAGSRIERKLGQLFDLVGYDRHDVVEEQAIIKKDGKVRGGS